MSAGVVTPTISVVIPVRDGARYLSELLSALAREPVQEVLVIDSGSTDGSSALARAAGVRVLEISPTDFGHGRTRNLGAESTAGELICFLTQDATPCPGWAAAYREAFTLDSRVGAAYGPHLPRPDTSPMIARELGEFFAGFSADGRPALQRAGDPHFLSNVNACYARACWEEVRFRDVLYAEDQAFGTDLLAAGWSKVYHPAAAVLHAHDYPLADFMRRYFDEYRGLRVATGHVEPLRGVLGHVRRSVVRDDRWLRERGTTLPSRAEWAVRSAAHHGGRRVFSALGSRAERLPRGARRRLSLEGRDDAELATPPPAVVRATRIGGPQLARATAVPAQIPQEFYALVAETWARGPAPLLTPAPGTSQRDRLRLAMLLPPFSRGSGGHNLLLQILTRLERRGHVCSIWMHDYTERLRSLWPAVLRHDINDFFARFDGPVYKGFEEWHGADVVIATGWQTVHPALGLDRAHARVYMVNDHEPEFYATSAESVIAADTYRRGLYPIAGSPWLAEVLRERYGTPADVFEYGVDHEVYRPRPVARRRDTIVYYARHSTGRRGVPLGLTALAELHRRRPDVRIVLFGGPPIATSFPHLHLGVLDPVELSWLYSEATAGLCLSLTNFSLMPKEMIACGLPCVELEGAAAESIFGAEGPLELAPLSPAAIADALERLLDDEARREQRSRAGLEYVGIHTWDRAADQVEAALRRAIAVRESKA